MSSSHSCVSASDHYDIVIVGAGPAGANLARLIDSVHHRVLLVDGSAGHDKVCGGLISPDAQDIFAEYDISLPKEILVSPQLFSVRTIDLELGLTRYYRRSYMNVDRRAFDAFLRGMIPPTVEIISARCERITPTAAGYLLTLSGRQITCGLLVGADGASSIVRRSLFREHKLHRYLAIQQWFPAGETDPYYSCVFDSKTSTGCSWIFFKDGKLIFGGAFEKQHGRAAFEEQKRKLVACGIVPPSIFAHPLKTEACLVSEPRLSHGICLGGRGAFLVGEAAGLISPSSFEGISYALSSAEALSDALTCGRHPEQIMKIYRRKTRGLVGKIRGKCLKRPFMYRPTLRAAVMKSGITSIRVRTGERSWTEKHCQAD